MKKLVIGTVFSGIGAPDNVMYRQCGNSIVVNVLENIFKSIFDMEVFGK